MNCVCTLRGMEELGGGRRCVQHLYIMGYPFHIGIMLLFSCFNQGAGVRVIKAGLFPIICRNGIASFSMTVILPNCVYIYAAPMGLTHFICILDY